MNLQLLLALILFLCSLPEGLANTKAADQALTPVPLDPSEEKKTRPIFLRSALEQGLRKGPQERFHHFQRQGLDLDWKDDFYQFWFPQVSLSLETKQSRLYNLATGKAMSSQRNTRIPVGTLALELGEYVIFNWGIDYLNYLTAKETYTRNKAKINELKRNTKLAIIEAFFALATLKAQLQIQEDYVRHSTYVYRLSRERFRSKQASRQDYFKAREDYLRAKSQYQEAKIQAANQDQAFAEFIADDPRSAYTVKEVLTFRPHLFPIEDALTVGQQNNMDLKDFKLAMANAQRSREVVLKENLPLPKLTLNLGAYTNAFGPQGSSTSYETFPRSNQVDVVASINASWTLFGSGGFLNAHKKQRAIINKELAHYQFYNRKRQFELNIRSFYLRIRQLEQSIRIAQLAAKNARKSFDSALDGHINKKVSLDQLSLAMEELQNDRAQLEQSKFAHLQQKIALAREIGSEGFPGQNFVDLAITPEGP